MLGEAAEAGASASDRDSPWRLGQSLGCAGGAALLVDVEREQEEKVEEEGEKERTSGEAEFEVESPLMTRERCTDVQTHTPHAHSHFILAIQHLLLFDVHARLHC